MSHAYYNENDPFAAAWLRELIKANLIAPGEVDERSIEEVQADDLKGFTQCHFFAGIGVWSYALRSARWSDDTPVWTGSCPCQPFSESGKRGGFSDKRHLWPAWFRLIGECRPDVIFGEQVASKDGLAWLDVVSADLEGAGYTIEAADICAAGVGAPHIRQRLYFAAESSSQRREFLAGLTPGGICSEASSEERSQRKSGDNCASDEFVADTSGSRRTGAEQHNGGSPSLSARPEQRVEVGKLADSEAAEWRRSIGEDNEGQRIRQTRGPSFTNGFWRDAEWLYCRDGRYRAVEPGTFPLVTGTPARVGRLRGYGNALNAEAAIAFIESYEEVRGLK